MRSTLKHLLGILIALTLGGGISASAVAQVEQNISLNGTRLTYYPRPDGNACFADCANHSACQAVTWIQAGTYNPRDPAMCYLLSAVTGRSPARGHFSFVKPAPALSGSVQPSDPRALDESDLTGF